MLWESLTLLSSFWKLKDCTNIFTVDALKHWRLNLWKLFFDGDECPYDVPAILCELNICMQLFSVLVCTTCLWNDEDDMETQSIKCLRKTHSLIPPPTTHTHTHSHHTHTHTTLHDGDSQAATKPCTLTWGPHVQDQNEFAASVNQEGNKVIPLPISSCHIRVNTRGSLTNKQKQCSVIYDIH